MAFKVKEKAKKREELGLIPTRVEVKVDAALFLIDRLSSTMEQLEHERHFNSTHDAREHVVLRAKLEELPICKGQHTHHYPNYNLMKNFRRALPA